MQTVYKYKTNRLQPKHPCSGCQNIFRCVCVFQEWRILQLRSNKYAKTTDCAKILLTRRRLLPLRETVAFFQIVGTEPGFKRLSVPFMWTARVKQSLVKCKEHTPNVPFGLKKFLCRHTNLFHLARSLPLAGEVCIEIPKSLLLTWLQSWTTHRLGGIL